MATNKHCEYCGKPFTAHHGKRKYCNDTCKQMAYFKRNGFQQAKNTRVERLTTLRNATPSECEDKTCVHGTHGREHTASKEEGIVKPETLPKFEYAESAFYLAVEKAPESGCGERVRTLHKEAPSKGDFDTHIYIEWVYERLNCLLESAIKLSNYSRIDAHTIGLMHAQLLKLVQSTPFQSLDNLRYPGLAQVRSLLQHTKLLCEASEKRPQSNIVFYLSSNQKAKILALRNEICPLVKPMKFSQLDFTEPKTIREQIRAGFEAERKES